MVGICRGCGAELTAENRYMHGSMKTRGNICIKCYNIRRRSKYHANSTTECSILIKGRRFVGRRVTFVNQVEKKLYQMQRRTQQIGCHPKTDTGSREGQLVDHIVEVEIPGENRVYRYYKTTRCSECWGEIRYDNHGYKVCVDCGLIDGESVLDTEFLAHREAHST
jgi:hypothetical protein